MSRALEAHLPPWRVAALLDRCEKWVIQRAKAGDFGPVFRDDGGWLIPAAGVNEYLRRHQVVVPGTEPIPQEVAA